VGVSVGGKGVVVGVRVIVAVGVSVGVRVETVTSAGEETPRVNTR
jgi:hypothetical protein